jgi:hypothetical protein
MLFRLFVCMYHCDGMAVQTSDNKTDSPCLTSTFKFILTHMSQAAPDIYRDCLLPLRHGYPLYRPEPDQGLPQAYRTNGVSIGDVGIIAAEGFFDFLFNICKSTDVASDSNDVNQYGIPDGTELIDRGEVMQDTNYFGEKAVVANGSEEHTSVSARGGAKQIG